jgi:CRP/FNR family transcriptional regulator, cyclic AMP receptor protein
MPTAVGLFELLSEDERRMLSEVGGTIDFPAGQILFQTGEPGGTLYVVESGKVEIYLKDHAGQKILLKTAECGDFFGEVSLFDARARTATAIAVADCRLFALDRQGLLDTFEQNPETALGMLAAMGGMLRASDKLLQSNISRNVNEMMEKKMSRLERLTDWIAWFSGSLQFLALTAVWFAVWIAVNTLPLGVPVFDPFPFGLLTMIVSLEAIFLSCFVLISQNRQAEKDHLRSDVEYEINIKAEMEIAHLHEKTDRMNEEMLDKFARLESVLVNKP